MKIEQVTSGTGVTQKRKVRKTAQTLDEMHQLMAAPSKSYLEYIADIEQQSREHLRKKKLPTERATGYQKIDGIWTKLPRGNYTAPQYCSRSVIFELEGYEEDSAVGFSARIIELVAHLRGSLSTGNIEMALDHAHDIGVLTTEARFKRKWEEAALRGEQQHQRAKEGAAKTNGLKSAKHQTWRAAADEIVRDRIARGLPALKPLELARRVKSRSKLKKHDRTIDRALKKMDVR
jgi:hypothetical protein